MLPVLQECGLASFNIDKLVSNIFMNTLTKEERLCGIKLIADLYQNGSSFLCYPYKISWQLVENADQTTAKILFAVPKKRYKRAVDRNLLKRRMRESYRLQKQLLVAEATAKTINFSITYIGKEINDFELMTKKMQKALLQLAEKLI